MNYYRNSSGEIHSGISPIISIRSFPQFLAEISPKISQIFLQGFLKECLQGFFQEFHKGFSQKPSNDFSDDSLFISFRDIFSCSRNSSRNFVRVFLTTPLEIFFQKLLHGFLRIIQSVT